MEDYHPEPVKYTIPKKQRDTATGTLLIVNKEQTNSSILKTQTT